MAVQSGCILKSYKLYKYRLGLDFSLPLCVNSCSPLVKDCPFGSCFRFGLCFMVMSPNQHPVQNKTSQDAKEQTCVCQIENVYPGSD